MCIRANSKLKGIRMQVCQLLDCAAKVTGSDYQTAKMLGVERQMVSNWRTGSRTCSAEDRALLADLAGVDPLAEMLEAIQERWAGKPKGERLRAVFAKRLQIVGNSYLTHIRKALKRSACTVPTWTA